jgi:FAD/FMN-containing dehydrogenase
MLVQEWKNWSGSIQFTPKHVYEPEGEDEVVEIVKNAIANKQVIRPVGSCHSSSPIIEANDILVSLEKFQGLEEYELEKNTVTIKAGMTLESANEAFLKLGLESHNLGDINKQTVVGAISTGTHGTGKTLTNLATMLIGGRLVNGNGEIIDFSSENPEIINLARTSLGTLGIFTSLKLKLIPAQKLRLREWCTDTDNCLEQLYWLTENNRNFDFYWYPRSDVTKIRIMNPFQEPSKEVPFAKCVLDKIDWSSKITPRTRTLKFDEMEYALPAEYGPICFQKIREIVKKKHRKYVGWRILYRTIAPDNAYLSPAYKRQTVTISLHQNNTLPFWDYFKDIEPVFRSYGGRPHWAKKHTLTAKEIRALYPEWDRFSELRQRFDPNGVFLNPYLKTLLLEEST